MDTSMLSMEQIKRNADKSLVKQIPDLSKIEDASIVNTDLPSFELVDEKDKGFNKVKKDKKDKEVKKKNDELFANKNSNLTTEVGSLNLTEINEIMAEIEKDKNWPLSQKNQHILAKYICDNYSANWQTDEILLDLQKKKDILTNLLKKDDIVDNSEFNKLHDMIQKREENRKMEKTSKNADYERKTDLESNTDDDLLITSEI